MKKKNALTKRQFDSLSQEQQAKELKKMAKRANVRASLLEETGIQTQAYFNAQDYNFDKGRLANRFYEGTKYKNKEEIKDAYKALSSFLNNKKSTLGGIEDATNQKVRDLIKEGKFDYETLNGMTDKEILYATKEASRQANKRLKELEHAKIDKFSYQVAQQYNKETGRKNNRFYTGGKFKNDRDIKIHLQNVSHFLNSKTSTTRGYLDVIVNRLDKFREKGIEIADKDEQKFLDFLSSKQFEALKQYADSNQILETFVNARNINEDVDKIQQAFEDYLNTEDMTFDEVQELLHVAEWEQGGLLH